MTVKHLQSQSRCPGCGQPIAYLINDAAKAWTAVNDPVRAVNGYERFTPEKHQKHMDTCVAYQSQKRREAQEQKRLLEAGQPELQESRQMLEARWQLPQDISAKCKEITRVWGIEPEQYQKLAQAIAGVSSFKELPSVDTPALQAFFDALTQIESLVDASDSHLMKYTRPKVLWGGFVDALIAGELHPSTEVPARTIDLDKIKFPEPPKELTAAWVAEIPSDAITFNPSLELVLDSFAIEDMRDETVLQRYLERFPQWGEDIVELHQALLRACGMVRAIDVEEERPEDLAYAKAAWQRHIAATEIKNEGENANNGSK
jgi:hypothetical protein